MDPTDKKLLDQVRAFPACPERSRGELAEGMPSLSHTAFFAPSRPTSVGSNATSISTACVTPPKRCPEPAEGWAFPRLRPFSPTWVLNWQEKRVRTWRCDSPIALFEVTPVQSTASGWTY